MNNISNIAKSLKTIIKSLFTSSDRTKFKDAKAKILKDTADIDFSGVTHDWVKNKQLYDELKKKCHPDKFDAELNSEATSIFKLVVKNKYNYKELLRVKEEAIKILGIKIE